MRLVDVHAHLDLDPIPQKIDALLERAKNVGVQAIIANGVNPASNRRVLQLAADHGPLVRPALGMYPNDGCELTSEQVDEELDFIAKQKPIALGEVGLDQKWSSTDVPNKDVLWKKQTENFGKVISLAEKKNLPLIIHSRKAELEVIEMLESSSAKKVVMHCFMGKKKYAKRIADNGWSFSIPVVVTRLNQTQEIVQDTPLHQLLTETDTPWLGPEPGPTNEPNTIPLAIEKMAQLKKMTKEELADQIYMNYMKMFL